MVLVGFFVNFQMTEPCLLIPYGNRVIYGDTIYAYIVAYKLLDKMGSMLLGTRIRGIYFSRANLACRKTFKGISLFHMIGKVVKRVVNALWFYRYLKRFISVRYLISLSRLQSRISGYICKLYIPICFRSPIFGTFSFLYGAKISEASRPYRDYTSFTDFFTRTLKSGVRPITDPSGLTSLCSPCDGTVLTIGTVNSTESTIDCVKGRSYRLDEFMVGVMGD